MLDSASLWSQVSDLHIALQDARLSEPGQTLADRAGPALADTADAHEGLEVGRQESLQRLEVVDEAVDDRRGQPRDPGEQAVPARADRAVEGVADDGEPDRPGAGPEVEQLGGGELHEGVERLLDGTAGLGAVDVVADDQLTVVAETAGQLLQLEAEQAPVVAELHDVVGDLLADPADHLEALQHAGDVADGDEVLDLQRRQGGSDLVEAALVALQGLKGLVRLGQDVGAALDDVS